MTFKVNVITLFPNAFPGVLAHSLTGRALKDGKWSLKITNLRDFGIGKHQDVDAPPAGGGAGLVMRPDVLQAALEATVRVNEKYENYTKIALSPRGKPFTQACAEKLSKQSGMTLICGRFEGFDQRFIDKNEIQEVSIGDFVMTGGEIAAQALIDSTIRLIDGVVGNQASIEEESFSNGLLEHPQYTKPSDWNGLHVPETLLSGHHGEIAKWRKSKSESFTKERRPDLWRAYMEALGETEQSDE